MYMISLFQAAGKPAACLIHDRQNSREACILLLRKNGIIGGILDFEIKRMMKAG